jgi:thioredoxin reductase (NADPH)
MLREEGRPVAVVLAGQSTGGLRGIEFLAQAAEIQSEAVHAVLVTFGDLERLREPILQAAALGQIKSYVIEPWRDADESFYHAVTKFLEDWDKSHRPQFELIQLVGERWDAVTQALRDGLHRSGVAFGFYDHEGERGRALLQSASVTGPLPVAIFFDGRVLPRPTAAQIATALGVNADVATKEYDVTVVGSGPAGLAAAVYGASEGLQTLIIENDALGGQASTSSMIRNYLGFPRGLTGADLTARAYRQAWFFGASFLIGRTANALRLDAGRQVIVLDDGSEVRSRTVVLATGVSYRRLQIGRLEDLIGRGVFYGAPVSEAPGLANERVVVVGGGNSSAQMALYLARYVSHVTLMTRGAALNEMSEYLVRDIRNNRKIEPRLNSIVVDARGDTRLRALIVRDTARNVIEEIETSAVFILIGAEPHTAWLPPEVRRDERGYVVTGEAARAKAQLETSLPGVFAVGDVRLGSMKRIAAAVGEGSSVIRMVHDYLADHTPNSR